jgi:hypothetical protein
MFTLVENKSEIRLFCRCIEIPVSSISAHLISLCDTDKEAMDCYQLASAVLDFG